MSEASADDEASSVWSDDGRSSVGGSLPPAGGGGANDAALLARLAASIEKMDGRFGQLEGKLNALSGTVTVTMNEMRERHVDDATTSAAAPPLCVVLLRARQHDASRNHDYRVSRLMPPPPLTPGATRRAACRRAMPSLVSERSTSRSRDATNR